MSKLRSVECPTCGGPLDFESGDARTVRCTYCNTSIIVPEELRGKKPEDIADSFSEQTVGLKEVLKLLRADRKIEAIKVYRSQTGLGLREAKEVIDRLTEGRSVQVSNFTVEARPFYGQTDTPHAPKIDGDVVRGRKAGWIGCILSIVLGLIILAVIGIVMFRELDSRNLLQNLFGLGEQLQTQIPGSPSFAEPVLSFGGEGTGPGLLTGARHIAVDNAGHIYVGEYENDRVQVFDTSGNFITNWAVDGHIGALAANRDGILYVQLGTDIFRFQGVSGVLIDHLEYDDHWTFEDITVLANGSIVTTVTGPGDDRIVSFDPQDNIILEIEDVVSSLTDQEDEAELIAVDGLGNIYVKGQWSEDIYKFSSDGNFMDKFGGDGDGPGQFTSIADIVVDGQGRI
ncbi:MAG: 6-bladed beta-propeller, partial [Anaerolineaceae bacterium]|nr:6-bladed beta-propeller [Anaerolineaceae bacterium]